MVNYRYVTRAQKRRMSVLDRARAKHFKDIRYPQIQAQAKKRADTRISKISFNRQAAAKRLRDRIMALNTDLGNLINSFL